jgi:hypothetical protein
VRKNAQVLRSQVAVAVVPLVLVPALGVVQGGFAPGAWVWSGALAAWGAALGIVLAGEVGIARRARAWLAVWAALLGWTASSVLWSVRPAQSLLEARRMIVYVAVALTLVVLARRGATSVLVVSTFVGVAGLVTYALARYLLGGSRVFPGQGALLSEPLGYANAVGILAVLGLLFGLGLMASGLGRTVRAAAAAAVPLLALALLFTGNHAAWLALAAGIGVLALLERSPTRVLRALMVSVPASALLVWLGHRSGISAGVVASAPSGRVIALVALACAAANAALVAVLAQPKPAAIGRGLVVAAVAGAALGGAYVALRIGSTQPRRTYWYVAWHDEYRRHPALGSGAGTFASYWVQSRKVLTYGGALDAHSLYLETLAELGPLGLLLLTVALVLPLRRVIAARDAALVPAAAAAYVAFLLHAGLDWDWEMPAVIVTAIACAAALLLADTPPSPPTSPRVRIVLLAIALVLGGLAIAGAGSTTQPSAVLARACEAAAEASDSLDHYG